MRYNSGTHLRARGAPVVSLRSKRDIHTDTYVTCTSHTGQGRKDEGEKRDATQRHETRSGRRGDDRLGNRASEDIGQSPPTAAPTNNRTTGERTDVSRDRFKPGNRLVS